MLFCPFVIVSVAHACMERGENIKTHLCQGIQKCSGSHNEPVIFAWISFYIHYLYSIFSLWVMGSIFVPRYLVFLTRTSGTWVLDPALVSEVCLFKSETYGVSAISKCFLVYQQ